MRLETEQMVRAARSRDSDPDFLLLVRQRSLRLSQPSFLLSTALTSLRAADVAKERLSPSANRRSGSSMMATMKTTASRG